MGRLTCYYALLIVAATCLNKSAMCARLNRRRSITRRHYNHRDQTQQTQHNDVSSTAAQRCFPQLTSEQRLPDDFVARSKHFPRLQYAQALQGMGGVQKIETSVAPHVTEDVATSHASMQPETRRKYCSMQEKFYPEFQPQPACNGTHIPAQYGSPWCWPASDPVHIFTVDCGIVENYGSHPNVGFTIVTNEHVVATNRGRWNLSADVPVQEFDELAVVAAAEYPSAPGHFLNEVLPALLFLDKKLPPHVPLLWPSSDYNVHILDALRTERVLSNRAIKLAGPEGALGHMRARKLYFLRTNRDWHHLPHVSWLAQDTMKASLLPVLRRMSEHTSPHTTKTVVTVLRRSGARRVINHDDIVQAVRDVLPGSSVHSFEPGVKKGYPFWKTATSMYDSCLVIGPHGANMNNVLFMRRGCWVIEIGFADDSFRMPSDYFCAARNMGLKYWLSLSKGGYASELTANLEEIRAVLRLYAKSL